MGEMDGWYIGGLPIDEEDIARAPMLFYRTSDVDHGGGLIIYTSTRVEYYNEDIFQSILDNARREHGQALVRIDVRE